MTTARLMALTLMLSLPIVQADAASIIAAERALASQDYTQALEELRQLEKSGDLEAIYLLGTLYKEGKGVAADQDKAKRQFERAAQQGHLLSIEALREMKNVVYLKEFNQIIKDAESGNASAQNRIGEMYEFGQGISRDLNEAFKWFQLASDGGSIEGRHNLARAYNFGSGTAQDFEKAEQLYLKGAQVGYVDSMFFLGTLYATGNGNDTSIDPDVNAYAWLSAAAQGGSVIAQTIEARLLMKLDEEGQQKAKDRAGQLTSRFVKK